MPRMGHRIENRRFCSARIPQGSCRTGKATWTGVETLCSRIESAKAME
jgi:hypothetical protein